MGLPIHAYTAPELVEYLITRSLAGAGGYVMTPNLDNLRSLKRSQHLMRRALEADVRVADGMPLIWASRIRGTPLPARVPGSDLTLMLADATARSGRRLYLLGGEPGTAERAGAALRKRSQAIKIVGTYCPPYGFERDPDEMARIRTHVSAARPNIVYVGLPFPKASELIADLRAALPHAWFLGLGISFSFVCGDVLRAPSWMQSAGLEWLHRLKQEPWRLGRRYLVEGVPFALSLFWSSLLERYRRLRLARQSSPSTTRHRDGLPTR